ncbi:hypothetical protein FG05_35313 [Fusarium graminearum]|nr:hypothetical protein FG05_35313 [Fusarium graminearum]
MAPESESPYAPIRESLYSVALSFLITLANSRVQKWKRQGSEGQEQRGESCCGSG